jgi:hypothetical protein
MCRSCPLSCPDSTLHILPCSARVPRLCCAHLKIRETQPAAMATVHPQSPAPTAPPHPLPEEPHGDAASGDPASPADAGGEIAALDKQLAVVVSGGEAKPSSSGAGGKLVAQAMRKYAAPRSSRFHGVTRYERARVAALLELKLTLSLALFSV